MLGRIHSAQYYLMSEAEYVNSLTSAVIGPISVFIGGSSLAEMSFIGFNWISCIFGTLFIILGFWVTYRARQKALSNHRIYPI
jgi:hypothetical protein